MCGRTLRYQNSAPSGNLLRTIQLEVNTRMKPTTDWYRPTAIERLGSPVFLIVS